MRQVIDRQSKENRVHRLRNGTWALKEPLLSMGRKLKSGVKYIKYGGLVITATIAMLTIPVYVYSRDVKRTQPMENPSTTQNEVPNQRFLYFAEKLDVELALFAQKIPIKTLLLEGSKIKMTPKQINAAIDKIIKEYLSGKMSPKDFKKEVKDYLKKALPLYLYKLVYEEKELTNLISPAIQNRTHSLEARRYKEAIHRAFSTAKKIVVERYANDEIKSMMKRQEQLDKKLDGVLFHDFYSIHNGIEQLQKKVFEGHSSSVTGSTEDSTETKDTEPTFDPNSFDDAIVKPEDH